MTWEDFESALDSIPGVYTSRETDGLVTFLIVYIGEIKTDYFLVSHMNNPDSYMVYHYILIAGMLAARM